MPEYVVLLKPLENFLAMPMSFYIIGGLLFVLILLLVAVLFALLKHHRQIQSYIQPVHDDAVKEAQRKAQEIVAKAMVQARSMRVESELAGIKSVAREKKESHEIFEQYQEEIKALVAETKENLEAQGAAAEKRYQELLKVFTDELQRDTDSLAKETKEVRSRLTTTLDMLEQAVRKVLAEYEKTGDTLSKRAENQLQAAEKDLDTAISRIESRITKAVESVQAETAEAIKRRVEEEFKKVEESVAAYRKSRQELIDNQMLALIEQVAEVALQKQLDLSEHAELVEHALLRAKQDGVFKEAVPPKS